MTLFWGISSGVLLFFALFSLRRYKKYKSELIDAEISVLGCSGAGKTTGIVQLIDKLNNKRCQRIWGSFVDDKKELQLRKIDNFIANEPTQRHTHHMVDKFVKEGATPTLEPEDCFLNIHYKHIAEADVQNQKHLVRLHDIPGGDFERFQENNQTGIELTQKMSNSCGVLLYIDGKNLPKDNQVHVYNTYAKAIEKCSQNKEKFPIWIGITKVDLLDKISGSPKDFLKKNATRFQPVLDFSSHIKNYMSFQSKEKKSPYYDGDIDKFQDFYQDVFMFMDVRNKKRVRKRKFSFFAMIIFFLLSLLFLIEMLDSRRFYSMSLNKSDTKKLSLLEMEKKVDHINRFLNSSPRSVVGFSFIYKNKTVSTLDKISEITIKKLNILAGYFVSLEAGEKVDILIENRKEMLIVVEKINQHISESKRWLRLWEKIQLHTDFFEKNDKLEYCFSFLENTEKFWKKYQLLPRKAKPRELIELIGLYEKIAKAKNPIKINIARLIVYRCNKALKNADINALQYSFPRRLEPLGAWIIAIKDANGSSFFENLIDSFLQKKALELQDKHWKQAINILDDDIKAKLDIGIILSKIYEFLYKEKKLPVRRDCIPLYVEKYLMTKLVEYFDDRKVELWQKKYAITSNNINIEKYTDKYLPSLKSFFEKSPYSLASEDVLKNTLSLPPKIKYISPALSVYFFLYYLPDEMEKFKYLNRTKAEEKINVLIKWIENILLNKKPKEKKNKYRFLENYYLPKTFINKWTQRVKELKELTKLKKVSCTVVWYAFEINGIEVKPQHSDGQAIVEWNDETLESFYLYSRISAGKQVLALEKDNSGYIENWHPWLNINYSWTDADNDIDGDKLVDDDVLQEQNIHFWNIKKRTIDEKEIYEILFLNKKEKYILHLKNQSWVLDWIYDYVH